VAGGATRTFYEKVFVREQQHRDALTTAVVTKQVDPGSGTLQFALTNSLNDSATVANRQTAPASGVTAFSSGVAPQSINVPSPQNLPSGAAPNSGRRTRHLAEPDADRGLAPPKRHSLCGPPGTPSDARPPCPRSTSCKPSAN
jgi:hypothetical protein